MKTWMGIACVVWTCAGCDGPTGADGGTIDGGAGDAALPSVDAAASPAPAVADRVVDAPGASGEGFGDPSRAVNGVRGGGLTMQSLDVYSIPRGEHLVLGFDGHRVVDGPGPDLVVFENAFHYGDGLTFMDPTVVEVSADGETWHALPHDYVAPDETRYSPRAEHWVGFAGVTPVLYSVDEGGLEPFDALAGGDAFDLADVPDLPPGGIRFVRLSAAVDHENPDTGAPFVRDVVSDGPDIDGVIGRYLVEAP